MMKVLIVDSSDFDAYPPGGVKFYIRNFLKYAGAEMDISLAGLTTKPHEMGIGWSTRTINGRVYPFFPFYFTRPVSQGRRPIVPVRVGTMVGLWVNLYKILLRKFDVAYIHFPELVLPFVFPKKRIPVVFHLHGIIREAVTNSRYVWIRNGLVASIFEVINKIVLERVDRTLTISKEGKDLCISILPQNVHKFDVVPAAVDRMFFRPISNANVREELGFLDNDRVILFVGRLEPLKGLDLLLDAVYLLLKKNLNARLVLAGEGTQRNNLKCKAIRLGIDSWVTFLGEVEHDTTLPLLLNSADVFALPSIKGEGCPAAVLEALSCGVPVVSTPVGDIPHIVVNGKTGFIVKSREPASFAEALNQALQKKKELRPECLSMAERYSAESVTSKIMNHLKVVVEKGDGR